MKQKFFNAIVFIVIACITGEASAQETSVDVVKVPAKRNQSIEKLSDATGTCTVKLVSTATGCDIVFENQKSASRLVGQPATSMSAQSFHFAVNAADNTVFPVNDPPVAHKSGRSSGTSVISDINVSITKKGAKGERHKGWIELESCQFKMPAGISNGDYDIEVSWNWITTDGGKGKRFSFTFTCTLEDGVCHAINGKGTGAANG